MDCVDINKHINKTVHNAVPPLPQDMEALKRSLALIESKMAQAKMWLKDPHGQPGN